MWKILWTTLPVGFLENKITNDIHNIITSDRFYIELRSNERKISSYKTKYNAVETKLKISTKDVYKHVSNLGGDLKW